MRGALRVGCGCGSKPLQGFKRLSRAADTVDLAASSAWSRASFGLKKMMGKIGTGLWVSKKGRGLLPGHHAAAGLVSEERHQDREVKCPFPRCCCRAATPLLRLRKGIKTTRSSVHFRVAAARPPRRCWA